MTDIAPAVHQIIDRLEERGDRQAAQRLRDAEFGSTSGEIIANVAGVLYALIETPLRRDPVVGRVLVDAVRDLDRMLYARPGRRLRHWWLSLSSAR